MWRSSDFDGDNRHDCFTPAHARGVIIINRDIVVYYTCVICIVTLLPYTFLAQLSTEIIALGIVIIVLLIHMAYTIEL